MRTDYELVRKLLLNTLDGTEPYEIECIVNSQTSRHKVGYHVKVLVDEGLIEASFMAADDDPYYAVTVIDVTPAGRRLAQSIRSDNTWNEAKAALSRVGGEIAMPAFAKVVESVVLSRLGIG